MELELHRNGLTATVTTKGAELISLKNQQGTEYIWSGDATYWPGRNPVLFPIVGNLADGTVCFKNKPYHMSRHGFARDHEFLVIDDGDDYAEFQLRHSGDTLEKYPYAFDFRVRHTLTDTGFETRYTIYNNGIEVLPYCVGAHTAFRCPLEDGEVFTDYELVFPEEETCPITLLNEKGLVSGEKQAFLDKTHVLPLSYEPFAQLDTLVFEGLKSKSVTLRHKENGHGVTMDFSQFPLLAFWTKGAEQAPFLCIEPWHGCAAVEGESGKFEDKPYVLLVQPGEEKQLSYTVSIH